MLQNNSIEHTEVIGHLYGNFFFSIFNIWLNKIHLCKQTQDKALTKPNKQENKEGLPHPRAVGLDQLTHRRAQQPHLPRGCDHTLSLYLSSWITLFLPRESSWHTRRGKQPQSILKHLCILCTDPLACSFHANRVFLQSATSISIENVAVEINIFPSWRNGFKSGAECLQAEHPAWKVFKNSASWYWSLECVTK